jgi:hypothetical protein
MGRTASKAARAVGEESGTAWPWWCFHGDRLPQVPLGLGEVAGFIPRPDKFLQTAVLFEGGFLEAVNVPELPDVQQRFGRQG